VSATVHSPSFQPHLFFYDDKQKHIILYQTFKAKSDEWLCQSLVGSWIVDLKAPEMAGVFTEVEQTEIARRGVIPFPRLPEPWAGILTSFEGVMDNDALVGQMADLITADSPVGLEERLWLQSAVARWVMLCKNGQASASRPEVWWAVNVWSLVLDGLLQLIPGVVLDRSVQYVNFAAHRIC
jgi:hypothetical protein